MQTFIRRGEDHHIPGYTPWLSSLLFARGVSTPEQAAAFLNPQASQLHDPLTLHHMPQAVALIRKLGAQGARAVVYGDYDVDGLCAAVIAREALERAGLPCDIYIPDRHTEGYGLNEEAVRKLAQQAQLLLTVDCGITAVKEVAVARALGMRVIVTDHHQPAEHLPEADAVINPLLGAYAFPSLCGAATAWKLSMALHGWAFASRQLDLAAIATIADMVPLLDENRVLATLGLKALKDTPRVGITALKAAMGLESGAQVTADRVGFGLAPRLNAGGRLTTAQDALTLLTTDDPVVAHEMAMRLNQLNANRQQEERQVVEQAEQLLDTVDMLRSRVIVLHHPGWNSGVVGLAAGRLAEKYGYPTVVLTQQGEQCTGSGRSAGGIDLYAALHACADLFIRFGGHKQAAGLTIATQHIPAFTRRFHQAVEEQLDGRPLQKQVYYDAPLALEEVSLQAVAQLEQLAPFGVGNPGPAFLLEDAHIASVRAIGAQGQHLKLAFRQHQHLLDGIAWRMGEQAGALPPTMRAVVRLSINEYQGRKTPQAQLTAYTAGTQAFTPNEAQERAALLKDLRAMATDDTLFTGEVDLLLEQETLPPQGALLVCRCHETAQAMRLRFAHLHTQSAPFTDRRGTSTILYGVSLGEVQAPLSHVVFCDGLSAVGEAAWAHRLFPGARLLRLPRTPALKALMASLRPTVEELRQAYVYLRGGGGLLQLPYVQEKAEAMGTILADMGLMTLQGTQVTLLPPTPTDPQRSALYRLLHEEDVWPTQSLKG